MIIIVIIIVDTISVSATVFIGVPTSLVSQVYLRLFWWDMLLYLIMRSLPTNTPKCCGKKKVTF